MSNALFNDDVDLHMIAAAAKAGWRFKSGRGWVSVRPPKGGASMWYGDGLTHIDNRMLASMWSFMRFVRERWTLLNSQPPCHGDVLAELVKGEVKV
jgi:hypothetical protein